MMHIQYGTVWSNDETRALDFYTNKLGFHLVFESPTPAGTRFLMFAPPGGGPNVVLTRLIPGALNARVGGFTNIAFGVSDVQATYEALKAKGVEFPQPPVATPWGAVQAIFADEDGNLFQLTEARA